MVRDAKDNGEHSFLTDTHAHLDMLGSYETIGKIVAEARRQGVGRVLAVGDGLDSSRRVAGLTEQFAVVYGAVGVHPHNAEQVDDNMIQQIWAVSNQPKIVAIGETGLDFYRLRSKKDKQIEAFRAQVELAKHLNLALVVHCREAYPETIKILKAVDMPADRVVIHCFSGNTRDAKELMEMGCYLSFAGNITFTNAQELRRVLRSIPVERLILETDSPYLAPHPHRGKQNQPALLPLVAEAVAREKRLEVGELAKVTSNNADNLFGLS